jgi:hypothetical protein
MIQKTVKFVQADYADDVQSPNIEKNFPTLPFFTYSKKGNKKSANSMSFYLEK